ncbi:MAG: glycosyltransferase family 4 protein [Planctomycetota bacterium]|nr:glycosyltransferase family 4 protein [Planctomycetota bacterium]
MRSLHINTERTWRGGEQQVIYLLQGLLERGDEASLICQPESPIARRAQELKIPTIPLRMLGEADLLAAARIAMVLRRKKISILHVHTPHAHTLALIAGRFGGRPRLIVSKRTDFSIFRNSFFGLNLWKYAHGIDGYIAISQEVRDVMIRDGVPPDRIRVVRSGVDPGRLSNGNGGNLLSELGLDSNVPIVGNVAHMAGHKGQRTLIEAAPEILRSVPEARIIIVGEGELERSLKSLAHELGVADRVCFPGFREDIPSFLSIFRIFAMPSHKEGLGTAVLDALAMRLPVVATRAGGIPEMIQDGVNGLLVPPKNSSALARGIVSLLKDPVRARALAEAGYRSVIQQFGVDTMVDQTRRIYEELLDGRAA